MSPEVTGTLVYRFKSSRQYYCRYAPHRGVAL